MGEFVQEMLCDGNDPVGRAVALVNLISDASADPNLNRLRNENDSEAALAIRRPYRRFTYNRDVDDV
jgi:hypothetical protein